MVFVRRSRSRRGLMARIAVAAALAITAMGVSGSPANALDVSNTPTAVTGNATWFAGLGSPYGGCGMPQDGLETAPSLLTANWTSVFPGTYPTSAK